MAFPKFDCCIICDLVRPEVGGKLSLLGFYGVAPNVEIAVNNPEAAISLAAVAGFPAVPDAGRIAYTHFNELARPDGTVLHRTIQTPLQVALGVRGWIIFGFVLHPPYPFGVYSIKTWINGDVRLDTSFKLKLSPPRDFGGMTGFAFPSSGAPN